MADLKPVRPRPIARERSPGMRVFLWVFSIVMILTAGTAFTMKLIDFYITATREGAAALGSFLIPVMNYLCIAAGFVDRRSRRLDVDVFREREQSSQRLGENVHSRTVPILLLHRL